jgi:nicotinic acid mononucleotide adenylyltransferase
MNSKSQEYDVKKDDNQNEVNKRKKVAILGGSFDPPTLAHIELACEIYNTHEDVDAVWLVPCGDGRSDKNLRSKGKHRLEMLRKILKDVITEEVPIEVFII